MDSLATEGDPIMLYIMAMSTSFEAVADAERATTAASAAAWPSGKRSLPLTKVGLCHTKTFFYRRGYNVTVFRPVLGSLGKSVLAAVLRLRYLSTIESL